MNTKTIIKLALIIPTLGVTGLAVMYHKEVVAFLKKGSKGLEKQKASKIALKEHKYWNDGKIKEGDAKTFDRLKEYWIDGGNVKGWSDKKMTDEAWSAVFMSWIWKEANKNTDLKRSASHSTYIREAIKNTKERKKGFKGYKPSDTSVEVGDMICFARQSGVDYDTTHSYKSHCDIVTKVSKSKGYLESIGGNVSNSVTMSKASIDKKGKLKDSKYFVVLKNK